MFPDQRYPANSPAPLQVPLGESDSAKEFPEVDRQPPGPRVINRSAAPRPDPGWMLEQRVLDPDVCITTTNTTTTTTTTATTTTVDATTITGFPVNLVRNLPQRGNESAGDTGSAIYHHYADTEYPSPHIGHVQQRQPRVPEYGGHAMIFAAAAVGDIVQVRTLCRAGASVDARDNAGSTPLHYAVRAGNRRMIADLLDLGANVHAEDDESNTAIDLAFDGMRYDIVLQLLRARAQMADLHVDSQAVMANLIKTGEVELARKLIAANARTDSRDLQGRTYLHLAVLAKNLEMIRLFSLPALAASDDNDQNTPLHLAVATQDPAIVRAVLNCSPPLNAINRTGQSPVQLACSLISSIPLIQLIYAGCDLNARDSAGNTPLHLACLKRNIAHVSVLLAGKASLTAINLASKTPLALVERATDADGMFIANLLRVCSSPQ